LLLSFTATAVNAVSVQPNVQFIHKQFQMIEVGPHFKLDISFTGNFFLNDVELLDFGDAPEDTSFGYGTLLASDGARHIVVPGYNLGPSIDAEPDGQPTTQADGDDLNGSYDDDDGILLFSTAGTLGTVDVDGGPAGGMLDAWVDYNANGMFDHPSEHLFGGSSILLLPGPNPSLSFTVPLTAVPGFTYARFRLSTVGGLAPTGVAPDGEVEDYFVEIGDPSAVKMAVIRTQDNGIPLVGALGLLMLGFSCAVQALSAGRLKRSRIKRLSGYETDSYIKGRHL
jgi:hypothetical protein